ncbi:MAG: hypothetical protein GEU73_06250 [Chloroflexi bacterium]|nr:hypothetical protein [Chloroflexota bacterium]
MNARPLVVVLILVLALIAAFAIPVMLIGTGLDEYEGEERVAGAYAIVAARFGCLESIDRFLVLEMKVTKVEPTSPVSGDGGRVRYRSELTMLTLFGIPVGTVSVEGGSIRCFRYILGPPAPSR